VSYTCSNCCKAHDTFEAAGDCCRADFVECPLSELPDDAALGHGQAYSYGKAFTGRWELVLNGRPATEPVRVYPVPPVLSKMISQLADDRYKDGAAAAKLAMRQALDL
jgi:hypothetical protein